MQSDVVTYQARINSSGGRYDDQKLQTSYRFGIKAKMHGGANEQFLMTKSTANKSFTRIFEQEFE